MKFQLRVCIDATRISDGRQVMLKMVPLEEGPYELEMNRLFSTEPLSSNPRNRCAPLLDVIRLPNDPPIMVHPLLRPFYNPRLQTFGEFVSFFAQACEVSPVLSCSACIGLRRILSRVYNSCMKTMSRIGTFPPFLPLCPVTSSLRLYIMSGTAHTKTSCSIQQTCIPTRSIPSPWSEVKIFAERQRHIHEPGALHDIFSSTLAFPAGTIQPTGLRSTCRYMGGIRQRPNFKRERRHTILSPPMSTTSGIWFERNIWRSAISFVSIRRCPDQGPEIPWVRVYEGTHRRHGSGRSHEASYHG